MSDAVPAETPETFGQPPYPTRSLACTVVGLADLTGDIKEVRLRIDDGGPFGFAAGQYAQVGFAGQPPRDYSMANPPGASPPGDADADLAFHIRDMGGGPSRYVARHLAVGDPVAVTGPYGGSYLRHDHDGPILAVAGGSGLAPIQSIVEQALRIGWRHPIHLYIGARSEADLYHLDRFRNLSADNTALRVTAVLSEPTGPTRRRVGSLADVAVSDFAVLNGFKAYVAGPPAMVERTVYLLQAKGLSDHDLHADAFYSASHTTAAGPG